MTGPAAEPRGMALSLTVARWVWRAAWMALLPATALLLAAVVDGCRRSEATREVARPAAAHAIVVTTATARDWGRARRPRRDGHGRGPATAAEQGILDGNLDLERSVKTT